LQCNRRTGPKMGMLEVVVPDGLMAGDVLCVESNGQCFDVVLPGGYKPGHILPVEAPSLPPSPTTLGRRPSKTSVMDFDIVVPDGVTEGECFAVETAWGAFEIVCPEGCGGGSAITCELPVAGEPEAAPPEAMEMAPDEPSAHGDADSGFRYRPGQRVQVLRSDGSYSSASVEYGYESVFDVLYCVTLDGSGLCKAAVPEEEMYDAENADDPNFGQHLEAAMAAMMEAAMLDAMLDDSCPSYD